MKLQRLPELSGPGYCSDLPDAGRYTTKELLSVLMGQVMDGTVTWDKNLTKTIEDAVVALDEKISVQLADVMHNDFFQKLEGSWRGSAEAGEKQ